MKYGKFKEYVVDDILIENNKKMIFSPVTIEEINNAEKEMNRKFPESLKEFYLEIGWGYFEDEDKIFRNLLMSPRDIADFYCEKGNYVYSEDREFLGDNEFVFFEVDTNCHMTINLEDGVEEGIYFVDKVAESIYDFVNKMSENPNYYDDI